MAIKRIQRLVENLWTTVSGMTRLRGGREMLTGAEEMAVLTGGPDVQKDAWMMGGANGQSAAWQVPKFCSHSCPNDILTPSKLQGYAASERHVQ